MDTCLSKEKPNNKKFVIEESKVGRDKGMIKVKEKKRTTKKLFKKLEVVCASTQKPKNLEKIFLGCFRSQGLFELI